MDINVAIQYAQLVNAAYAIPINNLTNSAGQVKQSNYGGAIVSYDVVTTIYANDLATDMNPNRDDDQVSIGLILQAQGAGDVVIAIRGTEGILEWIHDAEFLMVRCPFLASAGSTEDGFTAMYNSFGTAATAGSPSVTEFLSTPTSFPRPVTSVTICGHSLGGALARFSPWMCRPIRSSRTRLLIHTPARARETLRLLGYTTGSSRALSASPMLWTSFRSCPRLLSTSMYRGSSR